MSAPEFNRLPQIVLLNRQRSVQVDLKALEKFALLVLPACVRESGDGLGLYALSALEEVVITLVSDRRIEQIHRQFMNIPGATDVITFEHGEIVISAQTAERCALEFGHSVAAETGLYLVHGLLHLNGFLDETEPQRSRMHAVQDRIWRAALPL
ncbi:MAG: putative rRNA maturation factor [Verrucomicrobia bacterium]|nr:MAG: putative rRNA maturation factor [Verrucomicrobiota bacterium]